MTFICPAWPPQDPAICDEISELLRSGDWGRYKSPQQESVRELISKQFGVQHVRLCGSGSAAVELALRAAGIGSDDQVVVSAYDYPGNFRAIEVVGAKPLLVDVGTDSPVIDITQIQQLADDPALSTPVRAVLASHLYGVAAPVQQLAKICKQKGWLLIEDACQTPGMQIGGSPAGQFGSLATLSFGGSKPLTAGSGGAILTNDTKLSAKINAYLDRPSDSQPLSSLQCAALIPQLNQLEKLNETRRATVAHIESNLNQSLEGWTWLSQSDPQVHAAYYKVAWACQSQEKRKRILARADALGLPIGAGFRAMSRSSERRCQKPFPLDNATRLGETTIVLDHAALLLPESDHSQLATALAEVNLLS